MAKRKLTSEDTETHDSRVAFKRAKLHPDSNGMPAEPTDRIAMNSDDNPTPNHGGTEQQDHNAGEGRAGSRKARKNHASACASSAPNVSRKNIRKLVPPRPYPTVPASVSATGPRSAHSEGKNYICITRHTELGAYLRRCKDVVLKDGYKSLHLNAMGAAIPHLMQLALSLPPILPFAADEIHTEVLTGTVEVQDELIPEDDDEDISYRTRGKSSVTVVITIGDGVDEMTGRVRRNEPKNNVKRGAGTSKAKRAQAAAQVVFREDELRD